MKILPLFIFIFQFPRVGRGGGVGGIPKSSSEPGYSYINCYRLFAAPTTIMDELAPGIIIFHFSPTWFLVLYWHSSSIFQGIINQ